MGLWVPNGAGDFTWRVANTDGQRPVRLYGTNVSSGATSNVKGSWTQVLSAIANDAFAIFIRLTDQFFSSGTVTDALVDVGVDPSGGSSYSVVIPDLLFGAASALIHAPGISYYFPLWIRAGSSIALRCQSVEAVDGGGGFQVRVFGRPRDPKLVKAGSYVTSFGTTSASSNGTAVTSGTTSEGAWTQMGSALTRTHWWWQMGMGTSSGVNAPDNIYAVDLGVGDASAKHVVIQDQLWCSNTGGAMSCAGSDGQGEREAGSGALVYIRSQCSATPDTGVTFAAYGLGG